MTWSKSVTLWCDGDDCPRHTGEMPFEKVGKARKHAMDNKGWSFDRDTREDFCPECSQ